MKYLLFFVIFFSAILSMRAQSTQIDEIEKLMKNDPEKAWQQLSALDSAERLSQYKTTPKYRIDFLFGRIASALNRNSQAANYLKAAFHSDSVQKNSKLYIRTGYLLCEELLLLQDIKEATKYILLALDKSVKTKDLFNQSVCLAILSKVHYFNDLPEKSYEALGLAIKILEDNRDKPEVFAADKLVIYRSVASDYYANDQKPLKAIESAQKGIATLEGMTSAEIKRSSFTETSLKFWKASFYAIMASQYQVLKQDAKAKNCADNAMKLIRGLDVIRVDVFYKILHYYHNSKRFDEIISTVNYLYSKNTETDSINIHNQAFKLFLSQAYQGKNDFRKALYYLQQHLDITQSLNERARAKESLELETAYKTKEKESQLKQSEMEVATKQKLLYISVSGLIILSILVFAVTWLGIRRKKDNLLLAEKNSEIELKNAELARVGQFRDEMSGMIVHDLKNPLNTILNFTKHISGLPLISNTPVVQQTKQIENAAGQMLNLVTNFIDVQKLEEARLNLSLTSVPLYQLVEKAIADIEFIASQKNIRIEINIKPQIYSLIDEEIVVRVLTNLLTNAVKFSPNNDTIYIESKTKGEFVFIRVRDNGPGISPEMKAKLFNKFVRADVRNLGYNSSSGLGLAFSKLAIEAHGGTVGVESEPEKGSCFWFSLKISEIENTEEINSGSDSSKTCSNPETLKILAPVKVRLKQLKFYETRAILETLNELTFNEPEIVKWKAEVENAVLFSNFEKYAELIE
jgi:signal transduction histidine kinase